MTEECETCKHDATDHYESEVVVEDELLEDGERVVTTELQGYCLGMGSDEKTEEPVCACTEFDSAEV